MAIAPIASLPSRTSSIVKHRLRIFRIAAAATLVALCAVVTLCAVVMLCAASPARAQYDGVYAPSIVVMEKRSLSGNAVYVNRLKEIGWFDRCMFGWWDDAVAPSGSGIPVHASNPYIMGWSYTFADRCPNDPGIRWSAVVSWHAPPLEGEQRLLAFHNFDSGREIHEINIRIFPNAGSGAAHDTVVRTVSRVSSIVHRSSDIRAVLMGNDFNFFPLTAYLWRSPSERRAFTEINVFGVHIANRNVEAPGPQLMAFSRGNPLPHANYRTFLAVLKKTPGAQDSLTLNVHFNPPGVRAIRIGPQAALKPDPQHRIGYIAVVGVRGGADDEHVFLRLHTTAGCPRICWTWHDLGRPSEAGRMRPPVIVGYWQDRRYHVRVFVVANKRSDKCSGNRPPSLGTICWQLFERHHDGQRWLSWENHGVPRYGDCPQAFVQVAPGTSSGRGPQLPAGSAPWCKRNFPVPSFYITGAAAWRSNQDTRLRIDLFGFTEVRDDTGLPGLGCHGGYFIHRHWNTNGDSRWQWEQTLTTATATDYEQTCATGLLRTVLTRVNGSLVQRRGTLVIRNLPVITTGAAAVDQLVRDRVSVQLWWKWPIDTHRVERYLDTALNPLIWRWTVINSYGVVPYCEDTRTC
jgi:hypothetical protein